MKIRSAALVGLLAAVLLVPSASQAALKAYKSGGLPDIDSVVGNFDLSPIFGTSNFGILRTVTLSLGDLPDRRARVEHDPPVSS